MLSACLLDNLTTYFGLLLICLCLQNFFWVIKVKWSMEGHDWLLQTLIKRNQSHNITYHSCIQCAVMASLIWIEIQIRAVKPHHDNMFDNMQHVAFVASKRGQKIQFKIRTLHRITIWNRMMLFFGLSIIVAHWCYIN